VAYVPLLLTAPGEVGADTKQYLYLDPARYLAQVTSLWDPGSAMGTVTHQEIGYLLPMGPYYALLQALGVPTWVAQRLWTGSLLFLAGAGVLFLLRTLWSGAPAATDGEVPGALAPRRYRLGAAQSVGVVVAALAYMLSPYVLQYEARESVILLPWVGLPWMVGIVARALERRGWRYPAAFALVVALIGGTNATALVLVGVGPLLWVAWELLARRVHWRRALATAAKIALLGAAVSLWWVAGLAVEGTYGMDILRYTESVPTVARTTTAAETLRGLGYWFFYGVDKLGLYLPMAGGYMTSLWLIAVSFAVPVLAFLSAFVVRWRDRGYFVALVLAGTVLSVGAYPLANPSPLGRAIKAGATESTLGLALRSNNRAAPLVILGTAVLLGAAVSALVARWKLVGIVVALGFAGLVAADIPALWTGQFVAANLERPEHIPAYWDQAASYLDHESDASTTRVLTEPGIDFDAYRWGVTLDPVLPGLMARPDVERGIVPYGSPGSANLLGAVDEPVQEGTVDPSALGPLARVMSVGDIVVPSDLQYELYDTPRPRALWEQLDPPPPGLDAPVGFGSPAIVKAARPAQYPLIDETELGLPHDAAYPPPVAVFRVPGARPIIRSEASTHPLLLDGDGTGLVAAASAGLLDGQATIEYSPSLAGNPGATKRALAAGAALVVTDTNRRQAEQFGTVRENLGYTETAGEKPLVSDARDARLPLFPPAAGDDSRTVAQQDGMRAVQASGYGNPITYTPEDRPDQAVDGQLRTAWEVGAFGDPVGQFLRMTYRTPVTTDQANVVQPLYGPRDRWITKVTLRFDGGHPATFALGAASRTAAGQTLRFPRRTFASLQITVDATNLGTRNSYDGLSGVGFAEVRVAHQQVDEVLRMPEDLLAAAGTGSLSHRLTLVMTRLRAAPAPPRSDPEIDIARSFTLPTARTFSVSGTARLSSLVGDNQLDAVLGTTPPGMLVRSSGRMPGAPQDRASSTLDGNPATVWSPGLGQQAGSWLEYDMGRPVTFDYMVLILVADGRHSVPTKVTVSAGGQSRTLSLAPLLDSATPWATQALEVHFPALTGNHVRVTFDAVRAVTELDYYSDHRIDLPIAVAEVGIPGLAITPPLPAQVVSTCRSDLLSIDGRPVPVQITGSAATAQALGPLHLQGCATDAAGITLGAGTHVLRTAPGLDLDVGVNVDSLVLDSAPGGAALAPTAGGRAQPVQSGTGPALTVRHPTATSATVVVHHPAGPFWMVLGESTNAGWHATTSGTDLGPPALLDGYANGWYVTPVHPGQDMVITLTWTPQHSVDLALVASAAALAVCLALACWPRRLRRRRGGRGGGDGGRFLTVPGTESGDPGRGAPVPVAVPVPAADGATAVARHGLEHPGAARLGHAGARLGGAAPELGSPLRSGGARPRWWVQVLAPILAGAVTAAIVTPAAAIAVAGATLLGLLLAPGRAVVAAGCVAMLVAVDWLVTTGQQQHRFTAEFGWPTHFGSVNVLAWLAVTLLAADALVEQLRARRAHPPGPPPRDAGVTVADHHRLGRHSRRSEQVVAARAQHPATTGPDRTRGVEAGQVRQWMALVVPTAGAVVGALRRRGPQGGAAHAPGPARTRRAARRTRRR